jgi:hypothetical protein
MYPIAFFIQINTFTQATDNAVIYDNSVECDENI